MRPARQRWGLGPRSLALVVLAGAVSPSVQAQFIEDRPAGDWEVSPSVYVDQLDSTARTQVDLAENYLAEAQWSEALDLLADLAANHAGKLILLAPQRYVSVREFCQRVLAGLPPEPLAQYRARVDAEARQWYEAGRAERDRAQVARVVDEAYASSWGDDALWTLGELELEAGEPARARGCWEQLLASPPVQATPSAERDAAEAAEGAEGAVPAAPVAERNLPVRRFFPDSQFDPADVRARLILASIVEADWPRADRELSAFSQLHPGARGPLAGRTVVYADVLRGLVEQGRAATPNSAAVADEDARPQPEKRRGRRPLELGALAWTVPLEPPPRPDPLAARAFGYRPRRVAEDQELCLSYHPLVVGDWVCLATPSGVWVFDLATGQPAWGKNPVLVDTEGPNFASRRSLRACLDPPRYTLSESGGKLFGRLGAPVTVWSGDFAFPRVAGYLVGLDLERQGAVLWEPLRPADEGWAFEGPPVCDGQRLYVAMRRSEVRPQAHVACLDLATGKPRWTRLVCAAQTPVGDLVDQCTHSRLTLDGETLYFNTNLGAVAAIDKHEGAIRWLTTYRRAAGNDVTRPAAHWYRDLTPCLVHQGLVLAAPADTPSILALDAATGELRWEAPYADDVVHLLDVGEGQLVASGDRLWWIDLATGRPLRRWPDGPSPTGRGRGVCAEGYVYWPTRDSIYVFDQAGGDLVKNLPLLARFPEVAGGNLVIAGQRLLVATATERAGYQLVCFDAAAAPAGRPDEPLVQRGPRRRSAEVDLASTADGSPARVLGMSH